MNRDNIRQIVRPFFFLNPPTRFFRIWRKKNLFFVFYTFLVSVPSPDKGGVLSSGAVRH